MCKEQRIILIAVVLIILCGLIWNNIRADEKYYDYPYKDKVLIIGEYSKCIMRCDQYVSNDDFTKCMAVCQECQ